MLEGLEISIVNLSYVLSDESFGRFDSEYFGKEFLNKEKILKKLKFNRINQLADVTDGEHGSPDLDENSGIVYFSGHNIKENTIDFEDVRYCSLKLHQKNLRSSVRAGNILMSIVGSVGKASVIYKNILANSDRNVATIKNISNETNPYWLSVFLNSKFGYFQTQRFSTGNVQPLLNLLQVKSIVVPVLSQDFQSEVELKVKSVHLKLDESKSSYLQAETMLLETLGMANFSPIAEKVNIKSFKDSFAATSRLDAEYYEPKYEYIENAFSRFQKIKLADLVNYPISSGITPKAGGDDYTDAENGVPFIRAVDLVNGLVDTDNLNYIKPEVHHQTLKRTQLKQNDFLFSIAGTVGRCSLFQHTFEANINQAVAILRFNDARVNHYYLMLLFNSAIGKEFVAKYARQGLQTNLNLTEVGELSIPIIDVETQTKIACLVQQSFALKAQSERLLDAAKQAVETAIETNEDAALAWLASIH